MDHFFNATINHNFGRRRLRGGSQTWVYAFLAERGLTIMYTGKGETRDDKKKTTTRTMTQAGSKQQPVEGKHKVLGFLPGRGGVAAINNDGR
jgi:hypothetical protein